LYGFSFISMGPMIDHFTWCPFLKNSINIYWASSGTWNCTAVLIMWSLKISVFLFFFIVVLWEYIVAFTKVLTMYQLYHTWIHTPNTILHLPSCNSFKLCHFCIYIHVYTLFVPYASSYPFPHHLLLPTFLQIYLFTILITLNHFYALKKQFKQTFCQLKECLLFLQHRIIVIIIAMELIKVMQVKFYSAPALCQVFY
jgi:hypothetical protein